MTEEKQNELLIHLLVVVQSELQITRDLLFAHIAEQKGLSKKQQEETAITLSKKVKERQQIILGQIKLHYENGFGSIDDLLNKIL